MSKWSDVSTIVAATAALWALALAWLTYFMSVRQQNRDEFLALKSIATALHVDLELMKEWTGAGGPGYSKGMTLVQAPPDWSLPGRLIWKFGFEAFPNLLSSRYLYRLREIVEVFARLSFSISRLFQLYDEYRSFVNSDPAVFTLSPLPTAYPTNINPEHFRLVAPFESDQIKWKHLKCINIGNPKDRQSYRLTTSFTSSEFGKSAVVETFENLFHRYMQHPEAKSLGPDGKPCKSDTRGLLGRAHIIAGKHRRIGKEIVRGLEEGDDLESLLFVPLEYTKPGEQEEDPSLARASERLIRRVKAIGIRALVRFGMSRRKLDKICRRQFVEFAVLRHYEQRISEMFVP